MKRIFLFGGSLFLTGGGFLLYGGYELYYSLLSYLSKGNYWGRFYDSFIKGIVITLFGLLFIAAGIFMIISEKKCQRIRTTGVPVKGTITKIIESPGERRLYYEYRDAYGRLYKGKGYELSEREAYGLVVGNEINILIDPENPKYHIIVLEKTSSHLLRAKIKEG